jgi:hypothetical protein
MKGRLTMSSKYVIKPLDKASLEKFFDSEAQKVIRFYIAKSLFAQPETLDTQGNLPIHIPKEHIEQWAVQALGVSSVGAGSYPVDVINESGVRWGADIKMLSCKVNEGELTRAESGETSLSQKFTGAGNMLDAMFNDKKYHKIIQDFVEIYSNKMHTVMKERVFAPPSNVGTVVRMNTKDKPQWLPLHQLALELGTGGSNWNRSPSGD